MRAHIPGGRAHGPCEHRPGDLEKLRGDPPPDGSVNNPSVPTPPAQRRNPLHGLTLEHIVTALQAHYGWPGLAERIPLNCFASEPSIKSSLKFLRKTPWAREKVESLYLYMQRDVRRQAPAQPAPDPPDSP